MGRKEAQPAAKVEEKKYGKNIGFDDDEYEEDDWDMESPKEAKEEKEAKNVKKEAEAKKKEDSEKDDMNWDYDDLDEF